MFGSFSDNIQVHISCIREVTTCIHTDQTLHHAITVYKIHVLAKKVNHKSQSY